MIFDYLSWFLLIIVFTIIIDHWVDLKKNKHDGYVSKEEVDERRKAVLKIKF